MLVFGLTVAAIGMGIVFCELVLLIFVIMLITFVSRAIENKRTTLPEKKAEVVVQLAASASIEHNIQNEAEEVLVVIAAALAAMDNAEKRFIPLNRGDNNIHPAWYQAGQDEVMTLKVFSY